MSTAVVTALTFVAKKLVDTVIQRASKQLIDRLDGKEAEKVFRVALGGAVERYCEEKHRAHLSRPLLRAHKNLLRDPEVAAELAKLLHFDERPNAELIAQRWRACFERPPSWRDFEQETETLLQYFEAELRSTDMFRRVFEDKSIESISVEARASREVLEEIECGLECLQQLLEDKLGEALELFCSVQPTIRDSIRDYIAIIREKTRGFVGREFIFERIREFRRNCPGGYFFVTGDPGVGKSAIAAQLVKMTGCMHHFNMRTAGISTAEAFLTNVCAQLVAKYSLNYETLPADATRDSDVLMALLREASQSHPDPEGVFLVVDALDEVDVIGQPAGANLLFLPENLPRGVHVVVTTRRLAKERLHLRILCEQETLDIHPDSTENLRDVERYLQVAVMRPDIRAYLDKQRIGAEVFVSALIEKSEGNFMYLHYVVPEIAAGAYRTLEFNRIPVGLQEYYADHWRRMRGANEQAWFEYKLPVVMALTVVRESVSIELLMDFSGVRERTRVRGVLRDWRQFLQETLVESDGGIQRLYRVYHDSFNDFIADREEVEDERVSRRVAHQQIAESLRKDLHPRPAPPSSDTAESEAS